MNPWRPATQREVEQLLEEAFDDLYPQHQIQFNAMRVPIRPISVADTPGEFVFIVAEHNHAVLYWSDIEAGWEIERLNATGGINTRGSSQFELHHIMHQLLGDPERLS